MVRGQQGEEVEILGTWRLNEDLLFGVFPFILTYNLKRVAYFPNPHSYVCRLAAR